MKRKNFSTDEYCTACGRLEDGGNTFHHIISRGSGGPEEPWNEIPSCGQCHVPLFHTKGMNWMAEKFSSVKRWLIKNEWYFCEFLNKWTHPLIQKE